jgi:uncharacterized membrane protein
VFAHALAKLVRQLTIRHKQHLNVVYIILFDYINILLVLLFGILRGKQTNRGARGPARR